MHTFESITECVVLANVFRSAFWNQCGRYPASCRVVSIAMANVGAQHRKIFHGDSEGLGPSTIEEVLNWAPAFFMRSNNQTSNSWQH